MRTFPVLLLTACLSLPACRSDPVHYHTLTPLLSTASRSAPTHNELVIERVRVPPQVDRSQIVVRQGANGLVLLETDWWGASNAFNTLPGSATKSTVRIEVRRFDLVPGQYALLDSTWRLRSGQVGNADAHELLCQNLLRTPAGSTVEDLVMAQQSNLQQLAGIISAASRSGSKECPSVSQHVNH